MSERYFPSPSPSDLRRAGLGSDMVPIEPSDQDGLDYIPLGLYIEQTGQIAFIGAAGEIRTVTVGDLSFLPVSPRQVLATGTTASGLYGVV
jgi:hypothetical protein